MIEDIIDFELTQKALREYERLAKIIEIVVLEEKTGLKFLVSKEQHIKDLNSLSDYFIDVRLNHLKNKGTK